MGAPGAVLAVPGDVRPDAPLLVFFHGAGGSADQSVRLAGVVAASAGVLLLAPTSTGATWDLLAGRLGPDVARLDTALAHVFRTHDVRRVAFGGFSDGASYGLSLGLANGDLAEAVLALSPGFLAPPAQVGRPRVWVSHGTSDAVLPIERCGRRVVGQLGDAGYQVRYEEHVGGHATPPELVVAGVDWWLTG